ncbi:MAG: ATP-binding cassette domain-containing protein [Acidimicrobiales bacterium]
MTLTGPPTDVSANGSVGTGGSPQDSGRLECSGVTVHFGGLVALRDVDLAVSPATIVGLVGPNGAGKSTLFGVLSGLLRPTAGTVLLDGEDLTNSRPQIRAERGLARTFQHPELFTDLTVREHVLIGYRVRHAKRRIWSDLFTMGSLRPVDAEESAQVDELVELLGLSSLADRPALGLPLGFARLVELGRALATTPRVLLLDEPSSGLDSKETELFESTLRRVSHERGISVLLVEHDVELVMRMCSNIYVLDFGALIANGSPDEVRANPTVRAAYLGEEVSSDGVEEPDDELVMTDSSPAALPAEESEAASEPVAGAPALVVRDLSVRYGDAVALSGVSFTIGAGQVLAVLGANGAGKSSLARAVSGLVRPHGGSVIFAGEEIANWPAHRIRRAGLVHLPEGRGIFRGLTVLDNLRMAAANVHGRHGRREAVELALTIFPALATRRRQVASSLSGGEQQMLSLARALASASRLVIADELSLGLAPKMVDLVFDGLARARESGVTVIMIEQYVHRALAFADQCLVLQRGEMAWAGPANAAGQEVLSHYLGDAMVAT